MPLLLLLAGLLGSGCAPVTLDAVRADVAAGQGHLITTVPFIAQDAYQCGPAALAMVLRYWGAAADAEEIGRALYLPSAQGVLNLELEFEARRRGFRTAAFEGSLTAPRPSSAAAARSSCSRTSGGGRSPSRTLRCFSATTTGLRWSCCTRARPPTRCSRTPSSSGPGPSAGAGRS